MAFSKIKHLKPIKWLSSRSTLNKPYHLGLAYAGSLIYRKPSRKIFVLGVTGTKGKTTVLELINFILERAGAKTALLSSLRMKIGRDSQKNTWDNTMPGRFFIQKFLRKAVSSRCQYALIEVTSQGVVSFRHRFIDWGAAIFTNLAPEHIEFHGSFEKYRQAKISFFEYAKNKKSVKNKTFFLNKDDAHYRHFAEALEDEKVVLYSKSDLGPDFSVSSRLKGDFNKENIAAAVAFCRSQGVSEKIIKRAIYDFPGVPGRMEILQEKPFLAAIDYAHTPDSLEKVYSFLRKNYGLKNLICVLGSAGGGRDKWKRPVMGKIAENYCDKIILTNEDSYDENPEEIISQIEAGISQKEKILKIIDRKEAIKKAVSIAEEGDGVIFTGKGSESSIHLAAGKKLPWDEKKAVEEAL
jgi:UDP-N-acetylmuramoyl-L-alanyl-D-glutamate--2,6-diaminopimelate ligase